MADYFTTRAVRQGGPAPTGAEAIPADVSFTASDLDASGFSAGDIVNLFKFPTGARILSDSLQVTCEGGDYDTDATPAALWNLQLATAEDGTSASIIGTDLAVQEVGDVGVLDDEAGVTDASEQFLQLAMDTVADAFGSSAVIRVTFLWTRVPAFTPFDIEGVSLETGTTV